MHRGRTTHDMFRNLGKVVYMITLYNMGGGGLIHVHIGRHSKSERGRGFGWL